jgi:hypothetical protein
MLPHTSAIDVVPLWAVFIGSVVSIIVAVELGYRLGRWRHRRAEHETEGAVGGMVAAELGLLAFMLAITFSLAASRFDDRRKILLDEANAIGTCYLRAAMLPPDHRDAVRRSLREYVDVRLSALRDGSLEEAIRRTDALHAELWNQATAAAEKDPRSVPIGLFVQSLNDVIDLHAKRLQAGLRSRLPVTIWAALFAISAFSFTAMGYHEGLSGKCRSPAIIAVTLGFAIVIWLVADLERPHQGMLRVSQQPMVELQKSMQAER